MKKLIKATVILLALLNVSIASEKFDYKLTKTASTAKNLFLSGAVTAGGAYLYASASPRFSTVAGYRLFFTVLTGASVASLGLIVGVVASVKGLKKVDQEIMVNEYKSLIANLKTYSMVNDISRLSPESALLINQFECSSCNEQSKVKKLVDLMSKLKVVAKELAPKINLGSKNESLELVESSDIKIKLESLLGDDNSSVNVDLLARLLALNIAFIK